LLRKNYTFLEKVLVICDTFGIFAAKTDIGTLRETFAINSLSESHTVEYGKAASKRVQSQAGLDFAEREQARTKFKAQGDFKVDSKYTIEIGGRSKNFSQIAGIEDSYVFADDWDMPDGAKLPLWMLGFLY